MKHMTENQISEAGDGAPIGATAAERDDSHDGVMSPASGPDVTSSQGTISAAPHGLVRCPFCASAVGSMQSDKTSGFKRYWVRCAVCKAQGPAWTTRTAAHAAWNERAYG